MALKSGAAAERSQDRLWRDFWGRSIFDFCNNIGHERTLGSWRHPAGAIARCRSASCHAGKLVLGKSYQVPAPLVVLSACGMLFRFATLRCCRFTRKVDRDKLPMRQRGSGLCSVAREPGTSACQIDRAKSAVPIATPGPPAGSWRGETCGRSRTTRNILRSRRQ